MNYWIVFFPILLHSWIRESLFVCEKVKLSLREKDFLLGDSAVVPRPLRFYLKKKKKKRGHFAMSIIQMHWTFPMFNLCLFFYFFLLCVLTVCWFKLTWSCSSIQKVWMWAFSNFSFIRKSGKSWGNVIVWLCCYCDDLFALIFGHIVGAHVCVCVCVCVVCIRFGVSSGKSRAADTLLRGCWTSYSH